MSEFKSCGDWLRSLDWIQKGDCVYVISDVLELAKAARSHGRKLVLEDLVTALQEMAGSEGTLLFPAFNWDFCKGIGFDICKTPVRTGALPRAALNREDFARTAHPIYSFAVWGAHREALLANRSKDSFGPGTIFEKLLQWDAKALAIGLAALKGNTYIHHVEQTVGVPYRYNKEFTGNYTDRDGTREVRTYGMYVRDLDMDPRHIDGFRPLEEEMHKAGLIKTAFFETVPCHLVRIADLDKTVRRDILENDSGNMYTYRNPVDKLSAR